MAYSPEEIQDLCSKRFFPSSPVANLDYLLGRDDEKKAINWSLREPGAHILVYGARGAGKTSLCRSILQNEALVITCAPQSSFEEICNSIADRTGPDMVSYQEEDGKSETEKTDIGGAVEVFGVEGNGSTGTESATDKKYTRNFAYRTGSANFDSLRELILEHKKHILLDEFDTINPEGDVRSKIAYLIKNLSDNRCPYKVVICGIAETAEGLFQEHSSVARSLKDIHVKKLSDDSIRNILAKGTENLVDEIEPEVVDKITRISDGLPYYAHLLGQALLRYSLEKDFKRIGMDDWRAILEMAIKNTTIREKEQYKAAAIQDTADGNRKEAYRRVLVSMAKASDSITPISYVVRENPDYPSIRVYVGQLVKTGILEKLQRGEYRFVSPLMKSCIRMIEQL